MAGKSTYHKSRGPYQITIASDTTIILNDVLLGEVWICSGQSNMEWKLAQAETGENEIASANYPEIRLFQVEKALSPTPKEDFIGQWEICNPQSVEEFSAVAYFFGKELHNVLNVPIGLIHSSWGGTPSEAWTSASALQPYEVYRTKLATFEKSPKLKIEMEDAIKLRDSLTKEKAKIIDFKNENTIGKTQKWMAVDFNDASWKETDIPSEWSKTKEIGLFEGVIWLRKTITIPTEWAGKTLQLELGPIDEMDETYVNGTRVGYSDLLNDWSKDRIYKVPAALVSGEKLTIAIRAINTYNEGGLFGKPEQVKIFPIDELEQARTLVGKWKFNKAYAFPPVPAQTNPSQPTLLYNAMIHPITNMTIKGAIWYQGESNASRAEEYKEIFPAMITDWRAQWKQGDFPFYYVQIAPFEYGQENIAAELREAQRLTLEKTKNVGMAVTMDIGNPQDIHPTNKRDVGHRLALWALAKDYNQDLVYSGPLYHHHEISGSTIRVTFEHIGAGLVADKGSPNHFEIAGEDQTYYPAQTLLDNDAVIVSSPKVNNPVTVRYGWSNSAEPNLFNEEGLPASPFQTESTKLTKGEY